MPRRFILIGFDGCNPELVERFLPDLPNFKRLIEGGSLGPMLSTVPCDTPTNWTALATGATAATSGITGFAFHAPGTSLRKEGRPGNPEDYASTRAAEFIWEAADRQGKKCLMINYPFAWHSQPLERGVIVGGDTIRGGRSMICDNNCFCTQDRLGHVARASVVQLEQKDGAWVGAIRLRPAKQGADDGSALRLRATAGNPPRLTIEDSEGRELATLAPGEWSDYVHVPAGDETGRTRFFLAHLSPDGRGLQLFHSMVTRDEGWTKPERYATELSKACGPYQQGEETAGGIHREGWGGEHEIDAMHEILRKSGEVLVAYARHLAQVEPDWDMMFLQLHANDGQSHMYLGHLDPSFPLATPDTTRMAEELFRSNYIATDWILGEAAKLANEQEAVLVAVSDHSAIPTHTWADTARPFIEKGWLHFDGDGQWDPSRSKVRKMINHSIYVNLKGRQPDGIVEPGDYESVRDEIVSTLLAMRDPRTGACPIAVAARREDMDGVGANGPGFGDVVYLMRPGYTNQLVSEGALMTEKQLAYFTADPEEAKGTGYSWAGYLRGNHHDYLPNAAYPGLCSNRAVLLFHGPGVRRGCRIRGARTIDVAPTLAWGTGIAPPAQSEGCARIDVFEK